METVEPHDHLGDAAMWGTIAVLTAVTLVSLIAVVVEARRFDRRSR